MAELKDKYDILAILMGLIIDTEKKLYGPTKCLKHPQIMPHVFLKHILFQSFHFQPRLYTLIVVVVELYLRIWWGWHRNFYLFLHVIYMSSYLGDPK